MFIRAEQMFHASSGLPKAMHGSVGLKKKINFMLNFLIRKYQSLEWYMSFKMNFLMTISSLIF